MYVTWCDVVCVDLGLSEFTGIHCRISCVRLDNGSRDRHFMKRTIAASDNNRLINASVIYLVVVSLPATVCLGSMPYPVR